MPQQEQTLIEFLEGQLRLLSQQQQQRVQELHNTDPILTQIIGAMTAYTSALEVAKHHSSQ